MRIGGASFMIMVLLLCIVQPVLGFLQHTSSIVDQKNCKFLFILYFMLLYFNFFYVFIHLFIVFYHLFYFFLTNVTHYWVFGCPSTYWYYISYQFGGSANHLFSMLCFCRISWQTLQPITLCYCFCAPPKVFPSQLCKCKGGCNRIRTRD